MAALALPAYGLPFLAVCSAGPQQTRQLLSKARAGLRERHSILGTPGTGNTRLDRGKIEVGGLRVFRLGRIRGVEPSLFFGVCLHQLDLLRTPPRQPQIT